MFRNGQFLQSITARLIIILTLGTTLIWCGAAAYAAYVSNHELNEAFDRSLEQAGRRLLPLAADAILGHEEDDARAVERATDNPNEYLSYQLRDAKGRIVFRSHDAPSMPYDLAPASGLSTVGNYRLFTYTDNATGLTITIAETTRERWHAMSNSAKAMLWPLVGLIPLNILIIWLTVRGTLRPVQNLSSAIAQRGGQNLAPLDISGQPNELRPIAQAVARLVERLRLALDAERHFAANSAHELRTPIAGALAQTQRMIAELKSPSDQNRARDLEVTLKRLSSLAEKLMQISRVDAGVGPSPQDVDLMPALDLVVADFTHQLGNPNRLKYVKAKDATLIARMDMDAFAIVMRNLLDNAAKHGPAGGVVELWLEPENVIRVINDGPVVAPEMLAKLKQRFARGQSRTEGTGLGLAIVDTIMNQAMGKLELISPATGKDGGFEARLSLNKPKV